MNQIDWIEKRYTRTLMGRKDRMQDGASQHRVAHDGDCGLYNVHLQICTCGLHHCLLPLDPHTTKDLYPRYYDEMKGAALVDALLRTHEDGGGLWERCNRCNGEGRVEDSFKCGDCRGKGVVKFKMPEPLDLTKEEIRRFFLDAGFKEATEEDVG